MDNNLPRWGARLAGAALLGIGLFSVAATATAAPRHATAATTTTTTAAAEFHCPEDRGYFANPDEPNTYWHCTNNVPYQKQCPANLHWDDKHKRCDWPNIANNPAGPLIEPVVDGTPVGQIADPVIDQITDIFGG